MLVSGTRQKTLLCCGTNPLAAAAMHARELQVVIKSIGKCSRGKQGWKNDPVPRTCTEMAGGREGEERSQQLQSLVTASQGRRGSADAGKSTQEIAEAPHDCRKRGMVGGWVGGCRYRI